MLRAVRSAADRTLELLAAQVDFRLIPEFDPVVLQRVFEIDAGGDGGRRTDLQVADDFDHCAGVERLLEHRQHRQAVLFADGIDVLEHGRAAQAHKLDRALEAFLAKLDDIVDYGRRIERDVDEDEWWAA